MNHANRRLPVFLAYLLAAFAGAAHADLVVYGDALQNGFEDWSYGGGSDFANTAPVHAGSFSIALDGNAYNAVSLAHPTGALDSTDWPRLVLWVHGGSSGGQALQLIVQHAGGLVGQASLDAWLPGGIVAGTWQRVEIDLAAPPLSVGGPFDRIDLQSDAAGTQPTVYFDDIALAGSGATGDAIFADGFEGTSFAPLVVEHDIDAAGLDGDRFRWIDSRGLPRSAALAHNDGTAGPGGTRGGELRQFDYETAAGTRSVRATEDAFGGFGYVVSHPASEDHCTGGGDPSGLGHLTPGAFQRVFEGRHHAILRFTQSYPRYCTAAAPAAQHAIAVTIEWLFATGRDDPLWSITWNMDGVPVGRLEDDARAPYGQLRIDGAGSDAARAPIGGVAWGDWYAFTSSGEPLTLDRGWTWTGANRVPFVMLWTQGVDATMGLVQSTPIEHQDAGGYWGQDLWMQTSAGTSGCPGQYLMPCDYNWPFQSVNYELYGGPTQNARLAWGTNFGFLGQAQYRIRGNAEYGGGALALPGDPMAPGWPRKSYSTYVVLGEHSRAPVAARVGDVEAADGAVLSASVGSVATQAPAGVGDATPATLQPPGYDAIRGAFRLQAAAGALSASITPGARPLANPVFLIGGMVAVPGAVHLDGAALQADVDYFASLRADTGELWLTLHRTLGGGAHALEIAP